MEKHEDSIFRFNLYSSLKGDRSVRFASSVCRLFVPGYVRGGRWPVFRRTLREPSNPLEGTCPGSRENYEPALRLRQRAFPHRIRAPRNFVPVTRRAQFEFIHETEGDSLLEINL